MDTDFIIGIIASLLSGIGFGSMFVPVKPYDLKDGRLVCLRFTTS